MVNSKEFITASEYVKKLKKTPNNEELLNLYGFYKQAVVGDINIEQPIILNLKGRQKWTIWNSKKGTNQFDAEVEYITIVNILIQKYGIN